MLERALMPGPTHGSRLRGWIASNARASERHPSREASSSARPHSGASSASVAARRSRALPADFLSSTKKRFSSARPRIEIAAASRVPDCLGPPGIEPGTDGLKVHCSAS